MSYQLKLASARAIIDNHNKVLSEDKNTEHWQLSADTFFLKLKLSGATTEESLRGLSYEDLKAFCKLADTSHWHGDSIATVFEAPVALAKQIARIFRSTSEGDSATEQKRVPKAGRVERMTHRELVDAFDPEDQDNAVAQRLKTMSRGQRFVVFSSDGTSIHRDQTLALLQELRQGYPGREWIPWEDNILPVYAIGYIPRMAVDENPLYPGQSLRPGGICDQTGRPWDGIPQEVRQLVRLATETDEIHIDRVADACAAFVRVADNCLSGNGLINLRKLWPQAAMKFDELAKTGSLPTLKVTLPGHSQTAAQVGPFKTGKQVDWRKQ